MRSTGDWKTFDEKIIEYYALHEVHFELDKNNDPLPVHSRTEKPIVVSDSREGVIEILEMMQKDIEKYPVVDGKDLKWYNR